MRGLGDLEAGKEVRDPAELRRVKVSTCALSGEALREPIVACRLGNLYNKDAVLKELLERREGKPAQFAHVRKLKDVVTCVLTTATASASASAGSAAGAASSTSASASASTSASSTGSGAAARADAGAYICPITRDEFNGKTPFCVIWTSGVLMSRRALAAVKTSTCLVTGAPFGPADVFSVAPDEAEFAQMRAREQARAAAAKTERKARKGGKGKGERKGAGAAAAAAAAAAAGGGMGGAAARLAPELGEVAAAGSAVVASSGGKRKPQPG
eukprot:g7206.t1